MSAPVSVLGGAGGITANRAAIEHLAALHGTAAGALWGHRTTLEHELRALGSGAFGGDYGGAGRLDVVGLATARAALTDAIARLRRAETGTDDLAVKLRWAAQGYPWGTDVLDKGVFDQVNGLLAGAGRSSMLGAAGLMATAGAGGPNSVAGQDPRTVDVLVKLVGLVPISGLVSGNGDGLGIAIATGTAPVAAPRGLADLVAGLDDVNRPGTPGGIDVRVLTGADGRRRVLVDITGTREWKPGGRDPADLTTNTRALVAHNTAYAQGVVAALRQAGVRRGEPIMLVGHSLGGVIAVNTAGDLARTGEFTVTHVLTAGSPIGVAVVSLPPSIRVLALENTHDAVPRLDGRANPDRRSITTVSGAYGDGSPGSAHSLQTSYRPLADDAQRTGGRSVREFLTSARAFFGATRAEQHSYRVERR